MSNLISKNEPPYQYLADLFQDNLFAFKDIMANVNIVVGRPMHKGDSLPALYFTPTETIVKQSGIGKQKTVLKMGTLLIMYYTDDFDEDLFKVEQFMTQIVVGNNKVSSTRQFDDTGQEFMQLKKFDYTYVYDMENNAELQSIYATVEVTYQESYYGV